jgi:peptidoglycan hydrolase CwlO-like protein
MRWMDIPSQGEKSSIQGERSLHMTALLENLSAIDIILLVLVIISFIVIFMIQNGTRKAIKEIDKEITVIQQYQEEVSDGLDSKFASLKNDIDNKIQAFTPRFNELIKRVTATLIENKKTIISEIEERMQPLKSSLNEDRVSVKKMITDNENELKQISAEIEGFSKELEKMKDDIRERTYDLEL